jgi:hypothetical protein
MTAASMHFILISTNYPKISQISSLFLSRRSATLAKKYPRFSVIRGGRGKRVKDSPNQ